MGGVGCAGGACVAAVVGAGCWVSTCGRSVGVVVSECCLRSVEGGVVSGVLGCEWEEVGVSRGDGGVEMKVVLGLRIGMVWVVEGWVYLR